MPATPAPPSQRGSTPYAASSKRRHLVRQPDDARRNERRQLRRCHPAPEGPALQRAQKRARCRQRAARRHDEVVARAGAGRCQSLRQAADVLGGATIEERQRNFENKASEIRGLARNIAARSNQLGQVDGIGDAGARRFRVETPGKSGSSCFDPTLAERLRDAAAQADQPAELKLREAVFNEGPAGVANAVKNLWSNIGAYTAGAFRYMFRRQSS